MRDRLANEINIMIKCVSWRRGSAVGGEGTNVGSVYQVVHHRRTFHIRSQKKIEHLKDREIHTAALIDALIIGATWAKKEAVHAKKLKN